MVYCSSSLALASLEFFVHLDPGVAPDDLVSVAADIPEEAGQIERLNLDTLPSDWRLVDNPALQQLGADWAASLRSLALLVPSAVVDDEWNVLLNPAHAGFGKILMAEPKPFRFDARMFAR
jgi:RES domain-containing protein